MRNITNLFFGLIICSTIIVNGCSPVEVPLKSTYSDHITEITSTKSIDSIWLNLSEIFMKNGLPIKYIDKKKGLIRTQKMRINAAYTFEDTEGRLQHPGAWVVLTKVFNRKKLWNPKNIYGQWTIQIAEITKGNATIRIDPIVICTYHPNMFTTMESRGQSTDKLEELLKSHLKGE